jgi:hypothetical protein
MTVERAGEAMTFEVSTPHGDLNAEGRGVGKRINDGRYFVSRSSRMWYTFSILLILIGVCISTYVSY